MADDSRSDSSHPYPENCLLRNLPPAPTSKQVDLIEEVKGSWFIAAVIIPFILLVVIGGWGGTFQSGDASAYIVGAFIVCIAESIFQQREKDFEPLKRHWRNLRREGWDSKTEILLIMLIGLSIISIASNMYFAIHDRHAVTPSAHWVEILIFFFSLGLLPAIRFAATEYEVSTYSDQVVWTDFLVKKICTLHSRGSELVQSAESRLADHAMGTEASRLKEAAGIFKSIDDPWCEAHAASILASVWEAKGRPKKERRARQIADDALKRNRSREGTG